MGMDEYPGTLTELEARFGSEAACRQYLLKLRWPEGFVCPRCGERSAWTTARDLLVCAGCQYQASLTAGTIFQDTRKPLTLWFRAIWWVTAQKHGASALELQRIIGLGSYVTAWTWLHKLRRDGASGPGTASWERGGGRDLHRSNRGGSAWTASGYKSFGCCSLRGEGSGDWPYPSASDR